MELGDALKLIPLNSDLQISSFSTHSSMVVSSDICGFGRKLKEDKLIEITLVKSYINLLNLSRRTALNLLPMKQ